MGNPAWALLYSPTPWCSSCWMVRRSKSLRSGLEAAPNSSATIRSPHRRAMVGEPHQDVPRLPDVPVPIVEMQHIDATPIGECGEHRRR